MKHTAKKHATNKQRKLETNTIWTTPENSTKNAQTFWNLIIETAMNALSASTFGNDATLWKHHRGNDQL